MTLIDRIEYIYSLLFIFISFAIFLIQFFWVSQKNERKKREKNSFILTFSFSFLSFFHLNERKFFRIFSMWEKHEWYEYSISPTHQKKTHKCEKQKFTEKIITYWLDISCIYIGKKKKLSNQFIFHS